MASHFLQYSLPGQFSSLVQTAGIYGSSREALHMSGRREDLRKVGALSICVISDYTQNPFGQGF